MRRECLDYVIPLNSGHLRRILRKWVSQYGRPHRSLGPGILDRPQPNLRTGSRTSQFRSPSRVIAEPILGGLPHEYLAKHR